MKIQPIRPDVLISPSLVAGTVPARAGSPPGLSGPAAELLAAVQARINEQTLKLAGDPQDRKARQELRRARREADAIVRKALREEAAAKSRLRRTRREEAAIEDAAEDRARLGYTASELHAMQQTANRLNIRA